MQYYAPKMTMCHRCSGNVNMRMIQDSNMYQCCKDNIAICKLHHRDSLLIQVFPLWGASPDGFCSCDCCEKRIIGIKCPYSMRKVSPVADSALANSCFCFKRDNHGKVSLS